MATTAEQHLAPPTPNRRGRVSERTVLLVASFGAFLAFLDATIVNIAFPSIRASFPDSSISGLSWILNAYNIVFAAFLIVSGRLADLLGRRRSFAFGIGLFTLASAVCAASPSVGFLVGARMVQAFGAAVLVPASMALVVEAFPMQRRAHAIGLWGASAALASGLGPPIGGALVNAGGWRWAFLVNLPFGIAALIAGNRLLVESRAPGRRRLPDIKGAVLSAAMLGALTLGIVKGNDWGWTSWQVVACLVATLLLLGGFVLSSRTHRSPLLDPALLRIRPFAVGNLATIVAGMGFYAYLLTNILWLTYVWHYSIFVAGLALVPGALVAAVLAGALGPVADKHGFRVVMVPGALVWALAYVWYATRVGTTPDFLGQWLPGQVLSGLGVGATLPILGSAAMAAVPGGRFATASAVNSGARQIGAVLGIAVLVVIIGTPSPTSTVPSFRHGWVFSAICFAVVAVAAALVGRVRAEHLAGQGVEVDAAATVRLPGPAAAPTPSGGADLDDVPLLARLPESTREALAEAATPVNLAAGDWLFHAGDPAADLYVVRAGRLEVVIDGEPVRQLGAGAVLGELSLLTGGLRSASVLARRDSQLLRISHEDFTRITSGHAEAWQAVATVLAGQLQQPRSDRMVGTPQPRVVAVVALDPGAPVDAVAAALTQELARSLRVATPGQVDPDGLGRAERENDRVVLVADHPGDPWWQMCARQADRLIVVASSDADVPDGPPLGRTGADLVLVGQQPSRERTRAWAQTLQPWQIVVSAPDRLARELRAVAARIAGRSLGLVLGGGGARAFAHIGVLQELTDAGWHVDRIAGASQGSIIGALYAVGHDPQTVHDICYDEFVRARPFGDYTVPAVSLARGKRAERALRDLLGDALIEELPRQFRASSTDLIARSVHAHRSGPVLDAVLASIALPVLFPPRRQEHRLLADGGILDNLPVRLLTERDEGPLAAVSIGMGGSDRPRPHGPGAQTTPSRPRIPSLGETMLRTMFIGSAGAADGALSAGAVVVTPATMGVGLLEFHQLDRMVESGRAAGRALIEQAGHLLAR